MKVTRVFSFSAAHHLTDYHGDCERPHGHTYRFAVTVEGQIAKNGLVLDFAEMKKVVEKKVLAKVDHRDLNDSFKNPSAENLAVWLWNELKHIGKDTGTDVKLSSIQLWEGDNTSVIYEGA
ncbi:6-carboxytetrahydropterin synthase QueD [Candidatus Peregrinibacteria bacterium]|nr:6-carboxytetrahydropterin synthase QueD [Candidatus Peregrinibacteria bacterium]